MFNRNNNVPQSGRRSYMHRFNQPRMTNAPRRRWVHSPITIEHRGVTASITEDGKVILKGAVVPVIGPDGKPTEEVEYDEVEVSANLIFKLANLLHDTRKVVYETDSKTEQSNTAKAVTSVAS